MAEQDSDYLVFIDESGDHGLASVDPNYPMFVLACCLISKTDYVERITPALQRLKLEFWGHDEQVLHEHEIRKPNKDYAGRIFPSNRLKAISGTGCRHYIGPDDLGDPFYGRSDMQQPALSLQRVS